VVERALFRAPGSMVLAPNTAHRQIDYPLEGCVIPRGFAMRRKYANAILDFRRASKKAQARPYTR